MEKQISFCGMVCDECPAYEATRENNDAKRKEVAEEYTSIIKAVDPDAEEINPKDVNCDGCKVAGKGLFWWCNTCEVRVCGTEKGVENCAYCDEYLCDKLDRLYATYVPYPEPKAKLEEIRKGL